jgi:hypothetical protein
MSAVSQLCPRAILLDAGTIASSGSSADVIQRYTNSRDNGMPSTGVMLKAGDSGKPVTKVEVLCDGITTGTLYMGCAMEVRVHFSSPGPLEAPVLGIIIKDSQNTPLLGINNRHYTHEISKCPISNGYLSVLIPQMTLFEGNYDLDIHFGDGFRDIEILHDCCHFTVDPISFTSTGELPDKRLNRFFIRDVTWSLHPIEERQ